MIITIYIYMVKSFFIDKRSCDVEEVSHLVSPRATMKGIKESTRGRIILRFGEIQRINNNVVIDHPTHGRVRVNVVRW